MSPDPNPMVIEKGTGLNGLKTNIVSPFNKEQGKNFPCNL